MIEYIGRYAHKVAISNYRIVEVNQLKGTVSFTYKDIGDGDKQKGMTLDAKEFLRRFKQHILPRGFAKIRTYGYLANRNWRESINAVLAKKKLPLLIGLIQIPIDVRFMESYGINMKACGICHKNTMELWLVYNPWKKGDNR